MTATLPGPTTTTRSRHRDRPASAADPDRVRRAQSQAATALAQAAAFAVAAAVAAVLADGRWLALHLFLAGALVAAISGVTVLFVVTWAAAPCPPARVLAVQRALVGSGAAGVAAARHLDAPDAVLAVAGTAFAGGLALLGVVLVTTARAGVQRRFDVATAWYVAAVVAGLAAAGLGIAVGTGAGSADLRPAHVGLNLLGLVGLVIAGTLPTFVATQGRTKQAPTATSGRLAAVLGWQVAALGAYVVGTVTGADDVAAGGLVAYAVGLVAVAAMVPRPGRKQVVWAGPRLVALWVALGWWALAVAVAAGRVAGGSDPWTGRWLLVLVVAAYGQTLWGSVAYLGPVLRAGGHERLAAGFATTRSWVGFAAVNAAGVGLVAGISLLTGVALAVWVLDTAARAVRLVRAR